MFKKERPPISYQTYLKNWQHLFEENLSNKQIAKLKGCGIRHVQKIKKQYYFGGESENFETKGEDETEGNYRDVNYTIRTEGTGCKLTLEELLEKFQVDKKEWKVQSFKINTWTTSAFHKGQWKPYLNTQTKATLLKRKLSPIEFPIIQPITLNIPNIKKIPKKEKNVKTCVVFGDAHFGFERALAGGKLKPYHNYFALQLVLSITEKINPNLIIILGDMLDLAEWSEKFFKTPEMQYTTQAALIDLSHFFCKLRMACPQATIHYILGNHEHRLPIAIATNQASAYGLRAADALQKPPLLSISTLLGLDAYNIIVSEDYPYGEVWINDNLKAFHGNIIRKEAQKTAEAVLREYNYSSIYGHVHKQMVVAKTYDRPRGKRRTRYAFSPGCLCHTDGRVPSNASLEDWQNGLGIIEYESGNGLFNINPVHIFGETAIFGGESWQASKDFEEEMETYLYNKLAEIESNNL